MKKRTIALVTALVLSSLVVMGAGAYLKYEVLKPYDIAQDKNIVELPFLLMTDEALRYEVELAFRPEDPTEEPTTEPTEESTVAPTTEPATEPVTEPTAEPTTQPPTELDHIHVYDRNTVVAPTCTSEGYTWYACACGEGYQDALTEKLPHTYDSVVVEPTETADGYTEHTCSVCGDSYRDNYTTLEKPTEPATEPTEQHETYPGYDFSGGVPDDWYDDVLFIGDSRTLGLKEFARSGNADYFCGVGMSVFNIDSTQAEDEAFAKMYLEELLASKTYGKVFINLGINEAGYATSSLISAYKDLIKLVRKYQPDAKIVIQAIMSVSESYSSAWYFQPDHIFSINSKLQALADGSSVFYIDGNAYFTDSGGYLYEDITGDGCHLYARYYRVWRDWISYEAAKLGI